MSMEFFCCHFSEFGANGNIGEWQGRPCVPYYLRILMSPLYAIEDMRIWFCIHLWILECTKNNKTFNNNITTNNNN